MRKRRREVTPIKGQGNILSNVRQWTNCIQEQTQPDQTGSQRIGPFISTPFNLRNIKLQGDYA